MLKWLSEGPRLLAVAIVFAALVTAQAQSQSTNPITVTVEPDHSLRLGSHVVTRDGLIATLEAVTNGNHNERVFVRPAKGVSIQDLLAVAIELMKAGYVSVAVVTVSQPDEQR